MIDLNNPQQILKRDRHGMGQSLIGLIQSLRQTYATSRAATTPGRTKPHVLVFAGDPISNLSAAILSDTLAMAPGIHIQHVPLSYAATTPSDGSLTIRTILTPDVNTSPTPVGPTDRSNTNVVTITSLPGMAGHAVTRGYNCLVLPSGKSLGETIGIAVFAILGLLEARGVIPPQLYAVETILQVLEAQGEPLRPESVAAKNPAKRYAGQCMDRLPIFLSSPESESVAQIWKIHFQLYARQFASVEALPAALHSFAAGFEHPAAIWRNTVVIALRLAQNDVVTRSGFDAMAQAMLVGGLNQDSVTGRGPNVLGQQLSLLQFGLWLAYYTAVLNEVDPSSPGTSNDKDA